MWDVFAMCLCLGDGDFAIAVNTRHITTAAFEKAALAHEPGHCATDSFYKFNTPVLTRGRCERRADDMNSVSSLRSIKNSFRGTNLKKLSGKETPKHGSLPIVLKSKSGS